MVQFLVPAAVKAGEVLVGGAILLFGKLVKDAIDKKDCVGTSFQYGDARADFFAYDYESKSKKSNKRSFF